MGCGCAKKMSKSRRKKQELMKAKAAKRSGSIIRKRRVSRLIAIPGKARPRRKIEPTETTEITEET